MTAPAKINWFKYVLTDENNQWDIGILVWLALCITFVYRGWTAVPFDFSSFGFGSGALLGGGGALKWIRSKGYPELDQFGNVTGPTATATTTTGVGTRQT